MYSPGDIPHQLISDHHMSPTSDHHPMPKDKLVRMGYPIRRSAGQRVLAPRHGLSQPVTSFIASMRQGIHQMPFSHLRAPPYPESNASAPASGHSVQTLHTLNTYPNTRPCPRNPFCITGSTHARQNTASKHGSLFLSMWCSWGLAVPTNTKRVIVIHSVKDQFFQPRQNGAKKSQSPFKKHKSAKRILARRTKRIAMVGPKGVYHRRQAMTQTRGPPSAPLMVGRGGLEPPTSRLSGVRSNHLSYRPPHQHAVLSKTAPRTLSQEPRKDGGARRDRTDDLLNANQALSQLSYGPKPSLKPHTGEAPA